MVVLTLVAQKNGETVYFDEPIPQVHFMKLLSCSLYNSWDTLKNEGSVGLVDQKLNPSGAISKLPAGHYDLVILAKKIPELFSKYSYNGLETETNTPLGQLVIRNFGAKQISLDQDLAKLFRTVQKLPLITAIKRVITTTAYFIHCDLIDGNNNLFNGKKSKLLAKFDVVGKPYEKVRYDTSLQFSFRDCSTDSHVNSITLSVRDQDGELFDFKGMPIEFELELI